MPKDSADTSRRGRMANGRTRRRERTGPPPVPPQSDAQKAATERLEQRPGGDEVIIHRPDGQIRNSNTINRPDPDPPRDTKH